MGDCEQIERRKGSNKGKERRCNEIKRRKYCYKREKRKYLS